MAGVLVSGSGRAGPSLPLAAALAVEGALLAPRPVLLAECSVEPRRRRATALASPRARELEALLREAGIAASARGHLCHLGVPADAGGLAELEAAAGLAGGALVVVDVPARLWSQALERPGLQPRAGLLLVELPRERSLAALAVSELRAGGRAARISSRPLSPLAARRALAGVRPGGEAGSRAARLLRGLLPRRLASEGRGQSLPAVLGAAVALVLCALLLVAIGGAVTGKARVQRAADLAALSAARSMRDDLPRLLAPPLLPDGSINPRHLSRAQYLTRARVAGVVAARRNRVAPDRLRISFPRSRPFPPLAVRAEIAAEIDPGELPGGDRLSGMRARAIPVSAWAVAEASP